MLAGANMIYGAGLLESGITADYGALVADDALIRLLKHFVKGAPVNVEEIAFDAIQRVGPRGNFLMDKHTLKHLKHNSIGDFLIDRQKRVTWEAQGAKDMYTRCTERALEIIETHKVKQLPDNIKKQLRDLITEAEKELLRK